MRFRRAKEPKADPLETAPLGPDNVGAYSAAYAARLGLATSSDLEYLAGLFPPGTHYSPQLVERVGVASRCLQLCAQQLATMPLRYRRKIGLADQPAPQWVSDPDPAWAPNGIHDALFAIAWSMYQRGDAFCYVTSRYSDGYPATFTVLDPSSVGVGAEGGQRVYEVGAVPVINDDMLQITRNPTGALRGTGSLQAYAANLTAAYQQDLYAADVVASGGVPHAVLQTQRRLSAEQALELQQQWVERVQQRGAAPPVIPPDVSFTQLAWSPADLLLLDSRKYDGVQICGAFGTPPPLVGLALEAHALTYTNTSDLFELWWRSELYPSAARITNALSTWLPAGNWVEADPSAILAPSLTAKIDVATKAVAAKLMTENEARAWTFDLPPLPPEAIEEIDEPGGTNVSQQNPPTEPILQTVPRTEVVAI